MGCASITPPDGGAQDKLPPKVIQSYPDSAQVNVSPEFFSFTFDEYVKTKQIQDLLIISPTLENKPRTEIKKKTLFIRFDDSLKANTTYSISLSGCILDNNEGNVLDNYRLAFSTGPVLDSLTYSAFVSNAYSKKACEECIVVLYDQNQDSGALMYRPTYLAQTNAAGYATIPHLAKGRYWAQALQDINKNLLLDKEEFTSLKREIILTDSMPTDSFQVFPYIPESEIKLNFKMRFPGVVELAFDQPMTSASLNIELADLKLDPEFNDSRDTAKVYFEAQRNDTIQLKVTWDSSEHEFEHAFSDFRPGFKPSYTLKNNVIKLKSKQKLEKINTSRIRVNQDSLMLNIKDYQINGNELILSLKQKPESAVKIYMEDSAMINLNGQYSIKDSSSMNAYNPESSLLVLDLQLSDSGQYIVHLIKRDILVKQDIVSTSQKISYNDLGVGTYSFRIIKDINANEIWDSGDYLKDVLPEPLLLSEGTDLRPNWDKELIIKY